MNSPEPQRDSLPSQLLPQLLERLEEVSPLNVLDVGLGKPATVDFFSARRCRLHFSGLYEVLQNDRADEEISWREVFRREMQYPSDIRFDLCLFWDFFNYLDDEALRAFAETLAPFTGPKTVGHGFAVLNSDTVIPDREYSVLDRECFAIRPGRLTQPRTHPRPRSTLDRMLSGFTVGHSVLHRDGLLEMRLDGS